MRKLTGIRARITAAVVAVAAACSSTSAQPATRPAASQAAPTGAQEPVDAAAKLAVVLPEVRLDRIPLSDVIEALRDLTGANISVNYTVLEAVGVDRSAVVSARGENISLAELLDRLVKPLADRGVAHGRSKETIYLSTKADLRQLDAFRERNRKLLDAPGAINPRLAAAGNHPNPQNVHFDHARLKDVIARLSQASGVTIAADFDALAGVGVTPRQLVWIRAVRPTLVDVLIDALWQTGKIDQLDLKVDGDTIHVVPREKPKAA